LIEWLLLLVIVVLLLLIILLLRINQGLLLVILIFPHSYDLGGRLAFLTTATIFIITVIVQGRQIVFFSNEGLHFLYLFMLLLKLSIKLLMNVILVIIISIVNVSLLELPDQILILVFILPLAFLLLNLRCLGMVIVGELMLVALTGMVYAIIIVVTSKLVKTLLIEVVAVWVIETFVFGQNVEPKIIVIPTWNLLELSGSLR
jgi:hypothetical protein